MFTPTTRRRLRIASLNVLEGCYNGLGIESEGSAHDPCAAALYELFDFLLGCHGGVAGSG